MWFAWKYVTEQTCEWMRYKSRNAFQGECNAGSEDMVLRQQVHVLRRRTPKLPHLNNTDRFICFALAPDPTRICRLL
jgi:hypothetical protein